MSQLNYTNSPRWNNDGFAANNTSSSTNQAGKQYFAHAMGWVAPLGGTGALVSSLVGSAGTVTVTTAAAHNYQTGYTAVIAGATNTAFNGVYTVTVTGATTFTYTNATVATENPSTARTGLIEVVAPIGGLDVIYADLIVVPTFTAAVTPTTGTTLGAGTKITVTLTSTEPLSINEDKGTPYVGITIGGVAKNAVLNTADSTSTTLAFEYTTVTGDSGAIVVTNAIVLNGGQILDVAGTGTTTANTAFIPSTFTAPTTTATI